MWGACWFKVWSSGLPQLFLRDLDLTPALPFLGTNVGSSVYSNSANLVCLLHFTDKWKVGEGAVCLAHELLEPVALQNFVLSMVANNECKLYE